MNKLSTLRFIAVFFLLTASITFAFAQSRVNQLVQVLVTPDKPDWTYKLGEEASFKVSVLQHQVPVENVKISYAIGLEKMPAMQSGDVIIKSGATSVGKKVKLSEPGFLRCEAKVVIDGKEYRGIATAAFSPEAIKPTQVLPEDFMEFWDQAKAEADKIPLDAKFTLLPDRCTATVDVYQVNIQNYLTGSRIYGILARPKKEGKYPAVLQVPGAGIRPYAGIIDLAEKGVITLQIGIHGIPVNYETALYGDLSGGALRSYPFFNLDNRDQYYYKRVYLGCLRAVDFLHSLSDFDGDNLLVWGGSQGGALSIVTAALDNRVKGLVSIYPALSDMTGYLHGRAGGWPHMFNKSNAPYMATKEKIKVSGYYDVVNFARLITVPGFYTWGYNDETCPPTSYYATYNLIQAPKELYLVQETGHWSFPEQQSKIQEWLLAKLKN